MSKGELRCYDAVQRIFPEKTFSKIRPDWLMNPETGYNLELDLYCEDLKLAIEYNGKQHYHYPNAFHKTEQDFLSQIRRDDFKKRRCDRKGITLIIVPYSVHFNDIESYIVRKLLMCHKLTITK